MYAVPGWQQNTNHQSIFLSQSSSNSFAMQVEEEEESFSFLIIDLPSVNGNFILLYEEEKEKAQ